MAQGKDWGKGEFANMPKAEKMSAYPKSPQAGAAVEVDNMSRIDAENSRAQKRTRSHLSNQH